MQTARQLRLTAEDTRCCSCDAVPAAPAMRPLSFLAFIFILPNFAYHVIKASQKASIAWGGQMKVAAL